jgi:hypothetical protein
MEHGGEADPGPEMLGVGVISVSAAVLKRMA